MTKAMTLRLSDVLHDELRQEAFDRRASITAVIIDRLSAPVQAAEIPTEPAPGLDVRDDAPTGVQAAGVRRCCDPCCWDGAPSGTQAAGESRAPMRRSVNLAEIDRQRERGWPDFHPEDFCHRCGNRNISWWIDSAVWNPIMRPGGEDASWLWNEIICPQCFAELFEARFPNTSWRLSVDADTIGGRAFAAGEVDGDGDL